MKKAGRAGRWKREDFALPPLIVLFFLPLLSAAQDSTLPGKVARLLVQLPAPGPAEKAALGAEILKLGEEGIGDICRRLSPPGKADDSLARYALEAAGTWVMGPGEEKHRDIFARGVIRALKDAPDPDVKAFLIGRLQQAGGPESVVPLSELASGGDLVRPAVQALLAIRAPGTDRALIKALTRADQTSTPVLLQALGELRSPAAAGRIVPYAFSGEPSIREAALSALANLGDPRTEFLLSRVDIAASPREKAAAASRYLLFARRLQEDGQKDDALRVSRDLLEKCTGRDETQTRCAALTLFSRILGREALPELVGAMDSADPAFRGRALDLGLEILGEEATARWVEKARRVAPEAREQIIGMLGLRGDRAALDLIKDALGSSAPVVRTAAIEAAARIQGSDCLTELSPLWSTAGKEEAEALRKALLGLPPEDTIAAATRAFDSASPAAKAAIIELLGERRAKEHAPIVLASVHSEDEDIRRRALAALEGVVRGEDLPAVIRLLQAADDPWAVVSLQNALVASALQIADAGKRAEPIIESLKEAVGRKRNDLLRPLGRVGGSKALRTVMAETRSADPQVRSVAIYALSSWKDPEAAPELLKIARAESSAAGRKFVYLPLQGYIRLVTESKTGDEQKLASIKEAVAIAREPSEMNVVLDGLGKIKSAESLRWIASYLDDPAFSERAAFAAISCALPSPGFGGLIGLETAQILKRAAQHIAAEYDRESAEAYAHSLLAKEGFVPLFNGKDLSGWKGLVKDPPARARMSPDELRREQGAADKIMRQHWQVIDGMLVFDGRGESLCAAEYYSDFELFVDWKIGPGGDSGIYLRGSPQVQIWDPAQWPEGSGGLYNNQKGPSKPLRPADNPVGEWNNFYIRMAGERVTVRLNGVLVVDDAVMENYWERGKPVYPSGQIELQAHNTPLYFKSIFIRPLNSGARKNIEEARTPLY